jgi:uncharacterized protein (TIGR00159 family)
MPELPWVFWRFDLISFVDVVIVALIFYWLITLVQGTRATQLIWGIAILLIISALVTTWSQFTALNWLITNSIPALVVAIPVVFQPELRRALEQLGHTGALLNRPFTGAFSQDNMTNTIDEVCRAAAQLARQRYGALIVLERDTGLQDYVDRAVPLDALATRQLLITLFFPNTPLHDGAVIIRQDRVVAAAAVLPLTEQQLAGSLGTRHRAAVGISEESDAVALVVSEESGQISVATNGRLVRNLSQDRLRRILLSLFRLGGSETPEVPAGLAQ